MDPFSQDLLSQSAGSRVAPELLETLGRKASQMFQQNGVPLNQAVRELAAQHPELGNEHIKRVVEFANNVTFQELFQNGADKNVHFDVADPGVILRDLKDGGSPAHDGRTMNDYAAPPKQSGMQDANADTKSLDQHIWPAQGPDGGGSFKAASSNISVDDLFDHQRQLRGTLDKLAESHELAGYALDDAKDRLYGAVKHEILHPDGAGLGGVVGALTKLASEDLVGSVLPGMIERLREEGYQPRQLEASMEKRAGVAVNPQHPLVVSFRDLIKVAHEMVVTQNAIDTTNRELDQVTAELKKVAGPLTSGVRDALHHSGKLPPAVRQRFPRT